MTAETRVDDAPGAGVVTQLDPGGPNAIAMSYGLLADEWSLWIVQQALRRLVARGQAGDVFGQLAKVLFPLG